MTSNNRTHREAYSQVGRQNLPGTRFITGMDLTASNNFAYMMQWNCIPPQELREDITYHYALMGHTATFPIHMWEMLPNGLVRIVVTTLDGPRIIDITEAAFRSLDQKEG